MRAGLLALVLPLPGGCEMPHHAVRGEAGLVKPMFDPSRDM